MNLSGRCAVVVPCLNEARAIDDIVRAVLEHLRQIVVVDDGSSDETAEIARQAGATVLLHEHSLGKGVALRTGFDWAQEQGFSWALAMDGDGQHTASDIPGFLKEAESGGAEMIIGNRLGDAKAMPGVRRWVNRWMSRRLSSFCGIEIPDSQCGFRMIHLDSWKTLTFSARRFEVESELLVRFAAAGFRIRSVPVQTRYGAETSKIHPIRDTIRWFRWWAAIRKEFGSHPSFWPRPRLSHDATV
jgi:glycosyltransferase involved in cell wall biosynthesis